MENKNQLSGINPLPEDKEIVDEIRSEVERLRVDDESSDPIPYHENTDAEPAEENMEEAPPVKSVSEVRPVAENLPEIPEVYSDPELAAIQNKEKSLQDDVENLLNMAIQEGQESSEQEDSTPSEKSGSGELSRSELRRLRKEEKKAAKGRLEFNEDDDIYSGVQLRSYDEIKRDLQIRDEAEQKEELNATTSFSYLFDNSKEASPAFVGDSDELEQRRKERAQKAVEYAIETDEKTAQLIDTLPTLEEALKEQPEMGNEDESIVIDGFDYQKWKRTTQSLPKMTDEFIEKYNSAQMAKKEASEISRNATIEIEKIRAKAAYEMAEAENKAKLAMDEINAIIDEAILAEQKNLAEAEAAMEKTEPVEGSEENQSSEENNAAPEEQKKILSPEEKKALRAKVLEGFRADYSRITEADDETTPAEDTAEATEAKEEQPERKPEKIAYGKAIRIEGNDISSAIEEAIKEADGENKEETAPAAEEPKSKPTIEEEAQEAIQEIEKEPVGFIPVSNPEKYRFTSLKAVPFRIDEINELFKEELDRCCPAPAGETVAAEDYKKTDDEKANIAKAIRESVAAVISKDKALDRKEPEETQEQNDNTDKNESKKGFSFFEEKNKQKDDAVKAENNSDKDDKETDKEEAPSSDSKDTVEEISSVSDEKATENTVEDNTAEIKDESAPEDPLYLELQEQIQKSIDENAAALNDNAPQNEEKETEEQPAEAAEEKEPEPVQEDVPTEIPNEPEEIHSDSVSRKSSARKTFKPEFNFDDTFDFETDKQKAKDKYKIKNELTKDSDPASVSKEIKTTLKELHLRTIVTGVFTVALVALGLICEKIVPLSSSSMVYLGINLGMLLIPAGICYKTIFNGIKSLFKLQGNADSGISVALLAAIAHNIPLFFDPAMLSTFSVHLYSSIAVGALFLNSIGKLSMMNRISRNFAFVTSAESKYSVEVYEDINTAIQLAKGCITETPRISYQHKTRFLSNFVRHSYEGDPSMFASQVIAPIAFVASVVLGVVTAIITGNIITGITALSLATCISAPIASMICVNLPVSALCSVARKHDAVLVGYDAVEKLSETNAVMVDSKDLFPKGSVNLSDFKSYTNKKIDPSVYDAAAVLSNTEGTMRDLFEGVIASQKEMLPKASSVAYIDELGFTGIVGGKTILIGTSDMMLNNDIIVPSNDLTVELKKNEAILFIASNGELKARMIVSYDVDKRTAHEIQRLEICGISSIVRTNDPCLTSEFLAAQFGINVKSVRAISSSIGEVCDAALNRDTDESDALLATRGKTYSMLRMLSACVRQKHNISLAVTLQIVSVILGFVLVAFLSCYSGLRQVSTLSILIYEILWTAAIIIIPKLRKP